MATIPRIDLSRWLHGGAAERAAVGAEWDAAMRTTGAAVIVNHGLPPDVTLALHRATTGFFNRSEDAKRASDLRRGYGAGGYVPRGVEAVARSTGAGAGAGADPVESLTFSYGGDADAEPVAPPSPPELMPAVRAYWAAARAVLELVLAISAAALSLPDGHFDETYSREAKCNLKLAWYPAEAGACASFSASSATMRYGAHTDYTGFTILRQDPSVGGLEVELGSGEWVVVPPEEGDGLVINAGDLIQVWTNDRWRSPLHRVSAPPASLAPRPRLSLVFFTGPPSGTIVEALPGTVAPGDSPRYAPISAREHLDRKLALTSLPVA